MLPLLDCTAAELLPARDQYIEAHPEEFEDEEALFQGRAEPRVAAGDAPDEVCGAPDAVSV